MAQVDTQTRYPIVTNDTIQQRRDDEAGDTAALKTFRAYAQGSHESTIDVAQQRLIGRKPDHTVADNVLRMVISTASSRLKLERFSVASDENPDVANLTGASDVLRGFLQRFWMVNKLEKLQYDTTFGYLRDGNGAISLAWRAQRGGGTDGDVRLTRETWWDGESGVFMAYGENGEEEWAVKEFDAIDPKDPKKTITRRTVYYPDKIVRYIQDGKGWKEYPTKSQPAVVDWKRTDGRPLGIPIVHFPNGASVTDTPYGLSDLVGLIGLQDDLNATQEDMTAATRFSGFQMVTGTGIDEGKDYKVVPGGFLWNPSPNARFGVIPPGDASKISETHSYKRATVGVVSATPIHTITGGNWPSGEAIAQADMPAADKAGRLASVAGPLWTMVAHRATEIANTFGGAGLDESIPIVAIFAPPDRVNEITRIEIQQRKADLLLAVSQLPKTAMLKMNVFTAAEVDAILKEQQDATANAQAAFTANVLGPNGQ